MTTTIPRPVSVAAPSRPHRDMERLSRFRRVAAIRARWAAWALATVADLRSWLWWNTPARHAELERRLDEMTSPLHAEIQLAHRKTAVLLGILLLAVEDRPDLSADCRALLAGRFPDAGPVQDEQEARRQRIEASGLHSVPGGAR